MSLRIDSQNLGIVPDRPPIDSGKKSSPQPPSVPPTDGGHGGDVATLKLTTANLQSSLTSLEDAQSAQNLVAETAMLFQGSPNAAVAAQANLNPEDVQAFLS